MSLFGSRLHLGRGRDVRLELADELLVGDVGLRRHGDLVEPAALAEQLLRGREVETGERRPADGRHRAEADEAREPEHLGRAICLDPDPLAEPHVLLVRGRLVDDHFAGARPGALDERERVEARRPRGDAEAEVGRTAVHDRLAVLADQLRLAVHAALGGFDVGQAPHGAEERFVQRRGGGADVLREIERRLAADHGVRALAHFGEDRVEGLVDRVGEHECACDHRDAQHDRDGSQRSPELPSQQPFEREADHRRSAYWRRLARGDSKGGGASRHIAAATASAATRSSSSVTFGRTSSQSGSIMPEASTMPSGLGTNHTWKCELPSPQR